MQLGKAIKERHSVRKFSSKKPDWKDIINCLDYARYAPMAGNNFTLKFILVSDKEKIQKLADASQQPFITQAHYVVVACSDKKRPTNLYEKRGEIYLRQQAGAAIQNFLLKIHEEGLATCWIGHFVEEIVKRELNIPADSQVEALFPIGYEYEKPATKKSKIDLESIIRFNDYKTKKLNPEKKIDV